MSKHNSFIAFINEWFTVGIRSSFFDAEASMAASSVDVDGVKENEHDGAETISAKTNTHVPICETQNANGRRSDTTTRLHFALAQFLKGPEGQNDIESHAR